MGELRSKVSKGVKRYWRRRDYNRLTTATTTATDGSGRKRSWRIRIASKLKIKLRFRLRLRFNPKKLISSVHDGYVRMMMKVANGRVVTRGGAFGGYGGEGIAQFGMRPVKEYDEKMIIQMYKTLVMKHAQLAVLEADRASHGLSR